ncbi:MAG: PQQ-binding-like beta-propeller repeat protein [Candidatus Symbiothrix sp.]|jgi:hypothetical protein|nr:PQQ-binding-like beta-propeller repeat protein [Candidatus Symbiothrix sp.]
MKKFRLFRTLILSVCVMTVLTACEDDNSGPAPAVPGDNGVYILNEGVFSSNSAGLTYYNFDTEVTTADIFSLSGTELGNTGQDMLAYGSKLYISVHGSSNVTVLDLQTGLLLERIDLFNAGAPRAPRYLASNGGKVYVTAYDGTVSCIDTTDLAVNKTLAIEGAAHLEGIAAANGKLYVANGTTKDWVPDNKLYIVDIATFTKETTLEVGTNPYIVRADAQGDIYFTHQGNFGVDNGGMQRIRTKQNNEVVNVNTGTYLANRNFTIVESDLYFFGVTAEYPIPTNIYLGWFNTLVEKSGAAIVLPIIKDNTKIDIPYGIGVNPATRDVFIANTNYQDDGEVFVFGSNGVKKTIIPVGINANNFVFN